MRLIGETIATAIHFRLMRFTPLWLMMFEIEKHSNLINKYGHWRSLFHNLKIFVIIKKTLHEGAYRQFSNRRNSNHAWPRYKLQN